jgi:transcriptional regulator with XRE-family HTH domain
MSTDLYVSPVEWLRIRHKFTKRHVAQHLKMTEAAYGRMERGMFNISAENLKLLAELYSVPMEFFYTDAPIKDWESILETGNLEVAREPGESYGKTTNSLLPLMNIDDQQEEDLFLANLKINEMRKEMNAKDEALHIMKKKYLDLIKENETLKAALKKTSES